MGLSATLKAWGYFGELDPDALTINYTSDAAWRAARTRGHVSGLRLLSEAEYSGRKYSKGEPGEGDTANAISLGYRLLWPEAWNEVSAYQNMVGMNNNLLAVAPEAFRSGQGVVHTDATPDTVSVWKLIADDSQIPANGAWALKLHLYRQPTFLVFWGAWLLLIHQGGAEVARVSDDYTEALQLELLALLALEEPTSEQQTEADDLAELIYTDRHALSTPLGDDGWYNTDLEFVAIPEPAGRLHLRVNGQWEIIEQSDIIGSGQYGVLWPQTSLTIRSEGGSYFWQMGYPAAHPTGTMRLGRYPLGRWTEYDYWPDAASYIGNENGGAITAENTVYEPELGGAGVIIRGEVTVTLTPDETRRRFPFFYHASVSIEAGARTGAYPGVNPATWDSTAFDNPIMDVAPRVEGAHRAAEYTITLRDPQTENFSAATLHKFLEQQVSTLGIDGTTVLNNGLILESVPLDMADTDTQRNSTFVQVTLCDSWARLDEDIMDDAPIGDGERLGAYLRTILTNGGFTYLSGVSASAGRILPAAVGGEAPLFIPRNGITRGDYIRALLEEWGLGMQLHFDGDGVAHLTAPSTTPVAVFTNDGTPGACRVLRELELPREVGEYSNWFRIHSTDRRGNPIVQEFPLWKSLNAPASRTFIGRKKLEIREVPAARTEQDLLYVQRSIYEQFKGTPRFHAFDTNYIKGLRPGQYVTHDGVLCRVRSIGGGSIASDRMGLVLQEME